MRLQRTGAEEAAPSISTTNGQAQCTKPPPLAKTLSQCLWEACALVATWEAHAPCSDIVAVSQRGACLCTTLCRRESNAPATTLSVRHREASPCQKHCPCVSGRRVLFAATCEPRVPCSDIVAASQGGACPCNDIVTLSQGGMCPLQRCGRRASLAATWEAPHKEAAPPATTMSLRHREAPPLQRHCHVVTQEALAATLSLCHKEVARLAVTLSLCHK